MEQHIIKSEDLSLEKLKTELKLRGFSPLTVRNYSFFVEKMLKRAGKNAEDLNEDDAKLYLSELFDTKSKYTNGWMVILFLGDRKPKIVDFVSIEDSYNDYLKE